MKRYICIIDSIPVGHAVNVASHLADALNAQFGHTLNYLTWKFSSNRSVILKINEKILEELKQLPDGIVFREDALNWRECGIAFPPAMNHPSLLRSLQLFDGFPVQEDPQISMDEIEQFFEKIPAPR